MGLKRKQKEILRYLLSKKEKLTTSELVYPLDMSKDMFFYNQINPLLMDGLVERIKQGRLSYFYLTPKGEKLARTIKEE